MNGHIFEAEASRQGCGNTEPKRITTRKYTNLLAAALLQRIGQRVKR